MWITIVDCGGMIPVTKVIDEGQELQKIPEGSYVRIGKPSVFLSTKISSRDQRKNFLMFPNAI